MREFPKTVRISGKFCSHENSTDLFGIFLGSFRYWMTFLRGPVFGSDLNRSVPILCELNPHRTGFWNDIQRIGTVPIPCERGLVERKKSDHLIKKILKY